MHMALRSREWTLAELHRLPDDGNKYELVRGELFVTPPPTPDHETVLSRLTRILDPYAASNGLGMVYRPRSVVRFEGSEVEPDLMIRHPYPGVGANWNDWPLPVLVVEVLSDSTRRRDLGAKRQLYLDAGIPEYWIVDVAARHIRVVRSPESEEVVADNFAWMPKGVDGPLVVEIQAVFG